jgi:hypothetical protein
LRFELLQRAAQWRVEIIDDSDDGVAMHTPNRAAVEGSQVEPLRLCAQELQRLL